MTFPGLPTAQDAADVVTYLATFDADGNKVHRNRCGIPEAERKHPRFSSAGRKLDLATRSAAIAAMDDEKSLSGVGSRAARAAAPPASSSRPPADNAFPLSAGAART